MDTKSIFLLLITGIVTSCFLGCNKCKGDEFGTDLTLVVPMNTSPSQDTFTVGDTIWIEANIDKYVEVENHSSRIYLEGFNFFTELIISEISDTTENFTPEIEIVEKVGEVEQLSLPTLVTNPLFYLESGTSYDFMAGFIFLETGRYYVSFNTDPSLYEHYEHSEVYLCENKRRQSIKVTYTNNSTNQEAYENIFLETNINYLTSLTDFSRYKASGVHTFIVKE